MAGQPKGSRQRLSPEATREALTAMMFESDRPVAPSVVPRPGAWSRLATRIGVSVQRIGTALRKGAKPGTLDRWRSPGHDFVADGERKVCRRCGVYRAPVGGREEYARPIGAKLRWTRTAPACLP